MAGPDPSTLAAIMNRLWVQHLPEIEERVAVLERAAAARANGCLTAELSEQAASAAHKLAGILGTFGLDEGTVLAREAEELYSSASLADTSRDRAAAIALQIRGMVAGRAR